MVDCAQSQVLNTIIKPTGRCVKTTAYGLHHFIRHLCNLSMTDVNIDQLATLARLSISPEDAREIHTRIDTILDLVGQLQEADTSGRDPMAHPMDAVQVLRPDSVTESNQRDKFQKTAPAVENGLYLVPKVIS